MRERTGKLTREGRTGDGAPGTFGQGERATPPPRRVSRRRPMEAGSVGFGAELEKNSRPGGRSKDTRYLVPARFMRRCAVLGSCVALLGNPLFHGKAMLILRTVADRAGTIAVTAAAKGVGEPAGIQVASGDARTGRGAAPGAAGPGERGDAGLWEN